MKYYAVTSCPEPNKTKNWNSSICPIKYTVQSGLIGGKSCKTTVLCEGLMDCSRKGNLNLKLSLVYFYIQVFSDKFASD